MWVLDGTSLANVYTAIGHGSELNCVDVAPNDSLVATGGADKKIHLWSVVSNSGQIPSAAPTGLRVLSGHKRGIWDIRFSPVDKRLASCSGDRTVRVWNTATGECLRTLEGHLAAALRVRWLTAGTQLVSSGGDGLVKVTIILLWGCFLSCLISFHFEVWGAHDGECAATLDEERHDGKLWALDVARDGELLCSGDSEGRVVVWRDATRAQTVTRLREMQEGRAQSQELDNLVRAGEFVPALLLALRLDHRSKAKRIVESLRAGGGEQARNTLVAVVSTQLPEESLELLIKLCADWNRNAKHCHTAQAVMEAVFLALSPARLSQSPALKTAVEAWLAFSQRHVQRLNNLIVSSFVVDHALEQMGHDAHAFSAIPVVAEADSESERVSLTNLKRTRAK